MFDATGRRKYLSANERQAFIECARRAEPKTYVLCLLLAETGCRVSEAIALTREHIDIFGCRVVLRTLKRRRLHFRLLPISAELRNALCEMAKTDTESSQQVFPFCRQTPWKRVKRIMRFAGIVGPHASPKGLRHGFGMAAACAGVPPHLIQRWMGHAIPFTTAIYQDAVGVEERAFASRLWFESAVRPAADRGGELFGISIHETKRG